MKVIKTENVVVISDQELDLLCKLIQKYIPNMTNEDQSLARSFLIGFYAP